MQVDDGMAWEYNAPQFVDFTQPLQEDEAADEYFNFDHENGTRISTSFSNKSDFMTPEGTPTVEETKYTSPRKNTPRRNSQSRTPLTASALKDSNNLTPRRSNRLKPETPKGDNAEKENITGAGDAPNKMDTSAAAKPSQREFDSSRDHPQICTDLEAWNRSKENKKEASRKGPMRVPNPGTSDGKTQKEFRVPVQKVNPVARIRQTSVGSESAPSSPKKKLKRSNSSVTLSSSSRTRQGSIGTSTRNRSLERPAKVSSSIPQRSATSRERTNSVSKTRAPPAEERRSLASRPARRRSSSAPRTRSLSVEAPKQKAPAMKEHVLMKKPKLTFPVTPSVLKREAAAPADQKTAEERELEEIKRLRKELVQKRKKAEESHKLVLSSASYMPTRSVQAPTKAEGFQFATDSRIKNHPMETRKDNKDFTSGLRHHGPQSSTAAAPKRTIPAPFHFHEEKKRKREDEPVCNFKSVAERMQAFSKKTPDRFRTKPTHKASSPGKAKHMEVKLTIPKTPNFETKTRARSTTVVSQADIDAKELEEIKKYKFKAKPVQESILKNPTALHKVPTKEPTQFADFDLETDRRVKERQDRKVDTDEKFEFHANPAPKHILEHTVGVKAVEPKALTVPESPAFALKNRIRQLRQVEEVDKSISVPATRSKPVPHVGLPFQPSLDHKATSAKPFSFESRDKRKQKEKEAKIQKIYEEERKMREFHANPLPSDSPDQLPSKRAKQLTVPAPFDLEVEHRGAQKAEEWEHRLEEELKQQRQQTTFKAKPAAALYKQPFVPKRSTKNLTVNAEFELSTERRQERWAELEKYKHEKEVEQDIQQREMERRKREEEEAEIKRMRQEAVHHAKGVRHFKNVEVKPSSMPLTEPMTPRFSERLKSRFQKP